jgi:hypothetical protein
MIRPQHIDMAKLVHSRDQFTYLHEGVCPGIVS